VAETSMKKRLFLVLSSLFICLVFFAKLINSESNNSELLAQITPTQSSSENDTQKNQVATSSSRLIRLGEYRVRAKNMPEPIPTPTPNRLQHFFAKIKSFL
jgi:hypothetical protein